MYLYCALKKFYNGALQNYCSDINQHINKYLNAILNRGTFKRRRKADNVIASRTLNGKVLHGVVPATANARSANCLRCEV